MAGSGALAKAASLAAFLALRSGRRPPLSRPPLRAQPTLCVDARRFGEREWSTGHQPPRGQRGTISAGRGKLAQRRRAPLTSASSPIALDLLTLRCACLVTGGTGAGRSRGSEKEGGREWISAILAEIFFFLEQACTCEALMRARVDFFATRQKWRQKRRKGDRLTLTTDCVRAASKQRPAPILRSASDEIDDAAALLPTATGHHPWCCGNSAGSLAFSVATCYADGALLASLMYKEIVAA